MDKARLPSTSGNQLQPAAEATPDVPQRLLALDTYRVGNNAESKAFAHLTIRIFAGRSPAVKTELGRAALALLKQHLAEASEGLDVQLTVEIRDIDREAYFKDRIT